MPKKISCWLFLPLLCCCLLGQNDIQGNVNLQFRFANPGARAQAMGGAFIGLADDTTAIFANPAGLALLSSKTMVLEASSTRRDNNIPFYAGRIEQTNLQDFSFNLVERDFPKTTTTIPFAAYVQPKGRLKWGVFLAEQGNFERSFPTEGLTFPAYGDRYVEINQFEVFLPSDNRVDMTMRSLGVSLAGKVSDQLSLGVTAAYNRMDYAAASILYFPDLVALFPDIRFSPSQIAALEPLIGTTFAEVFADGEDDQLSVFAGLIYAPSERFSLGLAYKRQPKFDYDYRSRGWDEDMVLVDQGAGAGVFDVPDSYGLGFSFKPTEVAVLSLEVNRVLYSQLSDDFVALFASDVDPSRATQTVADTTEYHVGFEYLFTTSVPVALRLGYWFEPYHALQNTSLDTQLLFGYVSDGGDFIQGTRPTPFLQRFAKDLNHFTFGLGLTLGNNIILDLSGDIDEENSNFAFSSIYRF